MKKITVLLLLGLFMTTSAFAFGTSKFKDEVKKETSAVMLVREVASGGYDVITTEELHKLVETGEDIVVIDTMPYEVSYKKAHVPGAKQFLFPIPDMESWDVNETGGKTQADYETLLGSDKDKQIIVYCGFVKCTRSHNGAFWAKTLGYKNVMRYPGGIYAWKGAGYDVEAVK